MIWVNSISTFEWAALAIFLLGYLLYAMRIIKISKALGTSFSAIFWKLALRFSYFALFIIALLGPSFGATTREIKSVGKDIFICIDLSQSMNAFDIQPTRLERVKFELRNIIEAFNSDRKGLIMFSNEAFLQCPLTYDNNALDLFIQTLNTSLVPNSGTDFGPPLEMALQKLDNDNTAADQQKSKIIILISDGEDFGEDTESVANNIETAGIKLFTLGVGTDQGSKIQTGRGFKKDRAGQEVVTRLNSSSLRKLASDTGGKYFEINASVNDVDRLINTINLIEGELRDTRQVDAKSNKYFYFLALALILIILDTTTNVKVLKV